MRTTACTTSGGGPRWPAAVLLAALFASAPADAAPQKRGEPDHELPPAVDPYTGGEREAMDRASYVSFGPFPFGDGHTSAKVDEVLGRPLIWVETAHFRIGSSLEEYPLSKAEKDEKAKLKDELARLRERLPEIKAKPRELDPWLRLHLFAMRLEEQYADFVERFAPGVDFPAKGQRTPMGMGPFLGMPSKYTVLLTQRFDTFGRYTSHFHGAAQRAAIRHNAYEAGSLFYGLVVDAFEGEYASDTSLHCNVASGVAQNLVNGFRFYGHDPPLWWGEGIGHWYSRRIHPRWNVFTAQEDGRPEDGDAWEWAPRVRARVNFGVDPTWEEMLAWKVPADMTRADHMIAWSRVDYLLSRDDGGAAAYMLGVKAPLPRTGGDPHALLIARQLQATREAWHCEPAELERAWEEYVQQTYPKR